MAARPTHHSTIARSQAGSGPMAAEGGTGDRADPTKREGGSGDQARFSGAFLICRNGRPTDLFQNAREYPGLVVHPDFRTEYAAGTFANVRIKGPLAKY